MIEPGQTVYYDSHEWVITMLTREYITLELKSNPKIWRTVRRSAL